MTVSLSGYRTYLVAAAALLYGIAELLLYSGNLPDASTVPTILGQIMSEHKDALAAIGAGAGLFFHRKGVENTERRLNEKIDGLQHIVRLNQKQLALAVLKELQAKKGQ